MKQKDGLEMQVVFVDIFIWIWNILDGRTENTSKQQKILVFGRKYLVEMTLRLF